MVGAAAANPEGGDGLMCGRVAHRVAAVGHGAVASLVAFGTLPPDAYAALSSPVARVAVTALMAAGTVPMSAGRWSPDIDQYKIWNRWDRRLPDEWLGAGGPMRHRGISHWWGIPAIPTAGLWVACHRLPLAAAVLLVALAWVPVAGFWSHLVSDFWVGARYLGGRRTEADDPREDWRRKSALDSDDAPRGPGIPLMPWWFHAGIGWRCGTGRELLYVIGTVGMGVAAVYGSWRGIAVAAPWPVWTVMGIAMLAAGLNGRRGFAEAARKAKETRKANA